MDRRCALTVAAVALLGLWADPNLSHALEKRTESGLTVAFLYRFASLTHWPESSFAAEGSPFRFGVLGDAALARALEQAIGGRHVHGRPVAVEALDAWPPGPGLHVIFLADAGGQGSMLREAGAHRILTVSESSSFVERGGMIELQRRGKKLVFSINRGAAKRAELRIDPRLLRLAVEVVDDVTK